MESFRSNSDVSRSAEKKPKAEKVVTGNVTERKRSWLGKRIDSLTKNEATDRLEGYFTKSLSDMFCQSVKIIGDFICDAISLRMTNEPSRKRDGNRASYRQYYDDGYSSDSRPKANVGYNYEDLVFETRGDAELVLSEMDDMLEKFKVVSISDMFDFAGVSSNYTDNKYGWTDLREAYVERCRDGYCIRLPRPQAL